MELWDSQTSKDNSFCSGDQFVSATKNPRAEAVVDRDDDNDRK